MWAWGRGERKLSFLPVNVEMTWRCLCEASQHVVGRPGIGVKCRGLDLGVIDTVVLVLSLLRVC